MNFGLQIYVTMANGDDVVIKGTSSAVDAMERLLQKAGARWNPSVETWDFGYYDNTPRKRIDFNNDHRFDEDD